MQPRKVTRIEIKPDNSEVKPDNSVCTQLNRFAAKAGRTLGNELFGFFKHVTDPCFKWDLRAKRRSTVLAIKEQQAQAGLR